MHYWEDIQAGQSLATKPIHLSQQDILEFAAEFDPQPFHLNLEAGNESIFGGLCASGWQVCALMMKMLADSLNQHEIATVGSPGVEQLRWLKPVYAEDTLNCQIDVISLDSGKKDYGLAYLNIDVFNQNQTKVVTLITPIMIAKRKGSA